MQISKLKSNFVQQELKQPNNETQVMLPDLNLLSGKILKGSQLWSSTLTEQVKSSTGSKPRYCFHCIDKFTAVKSALVTVGSTSLCFIIPHLENRTMQITWQTQSRASLDTYKVIFLAIKSNLAEKANKKKTKHTQQRPGSS